MWEEEQTAPKGDDLINQIGKQELSALSVGDLETRISALREEISRCEAAIAARNSSRAAAEDVFKS